MEELVDLCEACGIEVVAKDMQKRPAPDAATAAGQGKISELGHMAKSLGANTLVFDGKLSGSQMANIAELSELKVLDRTLLILDIFARRASTSEGVLQVEIAQLRDRLTRLAGSGEALSRLGGGIGTRGPGESKLESDRRHIQRRITVLRKKLKELELRRDLVRRRRGEREAINIAVCGYTNAGKSSLINALCDTDLQAFDQVFATLDPRARRLPIEGPEILLSDTVGFIRKLPHELVESFRSTLDEIRYADLIIQVTDISDPDAANACAVVEDTLKELKADQKPRLHVFNKMDLLSPRAREVLLFRPRPPENVKECFVSVADGYGMDDLRQTLLDLISQKWSTLEEVLLHQEQAKLEAIRQSGWIKSLSYEDDGIHIKYKAPQATLDRLAKM